MGDSLIGLCGKGWVLLASDSTISRSVLVLKGDEDKIYTLDDDKIMGCQGEAADRTTFCEYMQKNATLHTLRTGVKLSTHATACRVQEELSHALRHAPQMCNVLLGGKEGDMYFVDYLGSMHKVPYAAHGYGSFFVMGIFDKYWRPDMTLAEGIELMKVVVQEVQRRLVLNTPSFYVKAITADKGVVVVSKPKPFQQTPADQ
eukprot:TRINITY_DN5517_c0_g1_i1.p2 TRINITY_DN5517_c0_g1~~TRINITY_DN5517_c0_g1_i1.p2  ORF type:complete len:202 (+),score=69.31 TRINITY_DN5517_c0_g1_i1:46-651(+)